MNTGTAMTDHTRRRLIAWMAVAAFGGTAATAAAASTQAFSIAIVGGRVQGDETLKVRKGDQVRVSMTSDQPMMLHLHGYEIEAKVEPPAPTLLAFKADLAGRFPIHVHTHGAGNHRAVLFIEVHP